MLTNLNVEIISTENNSINAASDSNYGEIAHMDIDLLKSEDNSPTKLDLNDQNFKLGIAKGTLSTLDWGLKR